MKALIIDDEIDTCYLLSSILKNKSIHSDYVNSLNDAISALKKEDHEIIFLDNHLQDGLGIDFIHEIKKFRPTAKLIMITANGTLSDRKKAFDQGTDFFIDKPFTRDVIYQIIDDMAV